MRKFGLIGYPLTHSFSKKYFTSKFEEEEINDCIYELYPIEHISQLPTLIEKNDLSGLNVTIPYKQAVLNYLQYLDDPVKEIKAVNTIKIAGKNGDMRLKGFNTDAFGFMESLKPLLKKTHNKALILGTGGASKAVVYCCEQLGIDTLLASRNPANKQNTIGYEEISDEIMATHKLIINTTPLGMYPNPDIAPDLPYNQLNTDHLLYDLVYNPEITRFMKLGKKQGASIKNGYEMLLLQAEKAWDIWNDPTI